MSLWFSCPTNTYGGDFMTKKASGTSIGYGKKSDFTRCLTVSPSADKYNLKSFWDENVSRKKGPSFALNRNVDIFQIRECHLTAIYQNNKLMFLHQPNIATKRKIKKDLPSIVWGQKQL